MIYSSTRYIRVSEKNVLPVEIHGLGDDKPSALEDRHIQEVIQLLRDILINTVPLKKKEEPSKQQSKSGIITGSSVRIGYVFKKRPGNQLCLVPASSVTDLSKEKDVSGDDLRSFQVLQEKVIVYAHQLYPGSPNRMSQLVKRINDKRQSTGSGVSISSYFQRVPSQSTGTSQVGTSSQSPAGNHSQSAEAGDQCGRSIPVAPPSGGRKSKIKGILKRVDEKASRRRHMKLERRKETKVTVKTSKAELFEITTDDSSGEETGHNSNKDKNTGDKCELAKDMNKRKEGQQEPNRHKENQLETSKQKKSQQNSSVVSAESSEDGIKPTIAASGQEPLQTCTDVRDSALEPASTVTCSTSTRACQEQGKSSKSLDYEITETQLGTVKKEIFDELIVSADSDIEILKIQPQTSTCIIGGMRADSAEADSVTMRSVEQMKEIQEAAYTSSDSQAEESILPTASFCTQSRNGDEIPLETDSTGEENDVNISLKDELNNESPKFKGNKFGDCGNSARGITVAEVSAKAVVMEKKDYSDSDEMRSAKEKAGPSSSRIKSKRKFPNFSDSDSDDMLPVKVSKTHWSKNVKKFVDPEETNMGKSRSKKWTFPRSISSGADSKKQTKLSFFMNKENQEIGPCNEEQENEDLSTGLKEELNQTPQIKRERGAILRKEISKLSSLKDLNEEHLGHLVLENEKHLRKIFEGKVKCQRHDLYKQGGRSKRDLNYESRLGQFSDEQVDVVMEFLMGMFCKRHHKYLDYVMKVLLPEMLIKLHMDVHGTSHSDSEDKLAHQEL